MPGWNNIRDEIAAAGSVHDLVRRKYLSAFAEKTGRNVIVYYSAWLQKPATPLFGPESFSVSDADKSGFMAVIHALDRAKGLDLVLHTPGGSTAATESLVAYLHSMFGYNIRAFVPQLAMSAGTMIACACKQIVMGKHSSLGPIDPQFSGIAAHGVVEEFERARKEIREDPATIPVWQPIISKYSPTLIGECEKAIKWSNEIVAEWLEAGMFADGKDDPKGRAERVIIELGDHALTMSHSRHIDLAKAQDIGLNVLPLEEDQELQDALLSVHHSCILTLMATPALKIIENQNGVAHITIGVPQMMLGSPLGTPASGGMPAFIGIPPQQPETPQPEVGQPPPTRSAPKKKTAARKQTGRKRTR